MKEIFYDWGGANIWLFYAINGWHNDVLDSVMQIGTALGDHRWFPVYLTVLAIVAWWRVARGAEPLRWLGVLAVFCTAYVLDGVLIDWLKHGLNFPRPPAALAPDTVHLVGTPEYKYSFPSGHAMFATTCATSLWPLLGREGRLAAVALVLWVAWSRISLGVHFPADVIAGALLAIAIVLGIRWALDVLAARALAAEHPPRAHSPRKPASRRHRR